MIRRRYLPALVLALCLVPGAASASPPKGATDQARFAVKAQAVWLVAAPYFGQSPASPMPSTRIVANSLGPRPRTVRLADGTSQAWFTRNNAKGFVNGADAPELWLIHEWAHVFQQSTLKPWEGEGGAQSFARYAAPRIYAAIGVSFSQPWSRATDGYRKQMDKVEKHLGWEWIKHGQWGRSLTAARSPRL